MKWLVDFFNESKDDVTIELNFSYLNTSSTVCILAILEILDTEFNNKKREIQVNWYYDDENTALKECAEEFQEDFSLQFNIIAMPSEDA